MYRFTLRALLTAALVALSGLPLSSQDYNLDNRVSFEDFLLFASAFGGSDTSFDLDGSGVVDFLDFLL